MILKAPSYQDGAPMCRMEHGRSTLSGSMAVPHHTTALALSL